MKHWMRPKRKERKKKRGKKRKSSTANFPLTIPRMAPRATCISETRRLTTDARMKSSPASKSTIHQEENRVFTLVDY